MTIQIGIGVLSMLLVFFGIDTFLDLLLGNRGKDGHIKNHFSQIRGGTSEVKEVESVGVLEEVGIENNKKYYTIAAITSLVAFLISLLVFKSPIITVLSLFVGVFIPNSLRKRDEEKRLELIGNQFRDALSAIMSSLKSGLSMNSAIIKTPDELEKIHMIYKDRVILNEFYKMRHDLSMGIPLDDVLIAFKNRLNTEEASDFVNSIIILKKKGGNLVEVMENTITMITDKMVLVTEIRVLTAAKRGEAVLLAIMPLVLVIGMSLFASDYMKPLWQTILGQIMAIFGFAMLIINYYIGKKVTNIET